jgi:hypothetical protein
MSTTGNNNNESNNGPILSAFISLLEELLQEVSSVFSECQKTKGVLFKLQIAKASRAGQERVIQEWHRLMKLHYAACKKRDEKVIYADIDLFKEINIVAKWNDPDFDDESRKHLWSYIDSLNSYSQLYCQIPGGMLSKIEGMASRLANQIQSGSLRFDQLNMQALGGEIMQEVSEDDLNSLTNNLGDLTQNLSGFSSMLGMIPGMGNIMSQAGQLSSSNSSNQK